MNITQQRLYQQRLMQTTFKTPAEVVTWLGAVQAQDYLGSLWAVGQRTQTAVEADIEQAIADRTIVRTWPMRGTLHFVVPADVRWMLPLLTPRIVARNAQRLRTQFDLDEAVFARSKEVLWKALHGHQQLTRDAVYQALEAAQIPAARQRGLHILWRLAQDGVICCGPRAGKQPTFVLLDEWLPPARVLKRDEALAELARRYFTSHGPATVLDFAWWSGLSTTEARTALELAKPHLIHEASGDQVYWFSPHGSAATAISAAAYLLPAFDEFSVAYKDRSLLLDEARTGKVKPANNVLLGPIIVIKGHAVGAWKRTLQKKVLHITPHPFTPLTRAEGRAFAAATERYGTFLGREVVMRD
jgi:hypothetical protein